MVILAVIAVGSSYRKPLYLNPFITATNDRIMHVRGYVSHVLIAIRGSILNSHKVIFVGNISQIFVESGVVLVSMDVFI